MTTRYAFSMLALALGTAVASPVQAQTYVAPGGTPAWTSPGSFEGRAVPPAIAAPEVSTTGSVSRGRSPADAWDGLTSPHPVRSGRAGR